MKKELRELIKLRKKICCLQKKLISCNAGFQYNLYINGVFSQVVVVDGLTDINITT